MFTGVRRILTFNTADFVGLGLGVFTLPPWPNNQLEAACAASAVRGLLRA
jgi:hypothetical protein